MSKVDLVVVNPGGAHGIYGALGDGLIAVEPPLWCRLVASYVRRRGFSVRIIDADGEGIAPDEVTEVAAAFEPRLIAVAAYGHQPSASTQAMPAARATIEALAETPFRGAVVLLGGHPSALPERTLVEEPVDFVCKGEGPATILGLLEGRPLEDVPGLVYAVGPSIEHVKVNASAPLIDLADLDGDAWDLLPMGAYRSHNWQRLEAPEKRRPYASIYTSLGCPYSCSFCCINAPFGKPGYRTRDPDAVAEEMVSLWQRYGVRTFKIVDEMFVLKERHYAAVCAAIVSRRRLGLLPKDLSIWAYARVDTVREEQLDLLRAAGIKWLALGIESGNAAVLDGAEKRLRASDVVEIVRRVQAKGIGVVGNFIFGLPGDDVASMRETLALAERCNAEWANFYCAMAYPGSKLYAEAVVSGAALPESWSGYSQHNADCRPLDTGKVDGREVLDFRDRAFVRYFSRHEYRTMLYAKFGGHALNAIDEMLKYKLPRKLLEKAPA